MATPRKTRASKPQVPVVRRGPAERKRLPPELEAFARGEAERLPRAPRPPTEPKLRDPRTSALVPGVGNRDARLVADARIDELTRLLGDDDGASAGDELGDRLAEVKLLGMHRGRSLTAFDALAVHVLGISETRAEQLAREGAARLGLPESVSDTGIATLMRTEASLLELGFKGRVSLRKDAQGREHLVLDVPVKHAAEALEAVGRRMSPLARDRVS